jgi:ankyrin repeat protein
MKNLDALYVEKFFGDCLNYTKYDLFSPIDPLTYLTPEGDSCLHIAAARENIKVLDFLIKAGLDINRKGDMGNTCLHYAKKTGNVKLIEFLLSRGALVGLLNDFGELS